MRVTPIAHSMLLRDEAAELIPGTALGDAISYGAPHNEADALVTDADHLAEFAGRACYKAVDRKNPATATTETYLRNILGQGHYSVLEHAAVTFYVEGVSRSLLLELERHRFLSFSVESQRYVDQVKSHPEPVIPPAADATVEGIIRARYDSDMGAYQGIMGCLADTGVKGKRAREIARAVLPNCTPVDFVVTGNLRCWRDVISKRYHVAADAEIREFATKVLSHLREIAPHGVQDIPGEPYETE